MSTMNTYLKSLKRSELRAELAHEDHPSFQRRINAPWFILMHGETYKQNGAPKKFFTRSHAHAYALAIIKNNPNMQGKIHLTQKA